MIDDQMAMLDILDTGVVLPTNNTIPLTFLQLGKRNTQPCNRNGFVLEKDLSFCTV